jgi:hypothetical protein
MSRKIGLWLAIVALLACSCGSGMPWSSSDRAPAGPTPAPSPTADPLAGTPAAGWGSADVVCGQGIPTRPPKGYSARTLAEARAFAVEWLRAGNSDKTLLATGRYSRFEHVVWHDARRYYKNITDYLRAAKHPLWRWYFLTPFDPATTKDLGPPRARGKWSVDVSRDGTVTGLRLTWSGTVAYRVEKDDRKYVVAVYRKTQWWWEEKPLLPSGYRWTWPESRAAISPTEDSPPGRLTRN